MRMNVLIYSLMDVHSIASMNLYHDPEVSLSLCVSVSNRVVILLFTTPLWRVI